MGLLSFRNRSSVSSSEKRTDRLLASFLRDFSIEVIPRTADKVDSFRDLLPTGTRVYIAHLDGTPIDDMVSTARRLSDEGFAVMPHFPARLIKNRGELAEWIARYQGDAGVSQGLLIGGGASAPVGEFGDTLQMLETGLFDGFEHLHIAGHPEGNRDIDPDGSDEMLMQALRWKQAFLDRTDARVAITTQFCFEAEPVIAWADRLAEEGIGLPIHIGLAGPAQLHTLIKYALACGVGPSLRVLQRRARDVTKLLVPYEPTELLMELAAHKQRHPDFGIERVHFFPLGGIHANAEWVAEHSGGADRPATLKHDRTEVTS
ncbi:methylenetetrahydrofolate reductase [Saccharospirillum salsuginis]|uniref:Methylenetetrahydrofolate reductase n=1 Tax=Saccharospirillum salsuginis TaxID=418750 RepID=A0A918KCA6_9GAMM|nr:methylenetetrahydrofolate reductase [Saccharospirillum salsuginis]GGX57284.1 methylenetetrahydrofolate reductase [Saccharospirillum salsuginis]